MSDPSPESSEGVRSRQPASRPRWIKPDDVIPGLVAMEPQIVRGRHTAIVVRRLEAYPNGFECTVSLFVARDDVQAFRLPSALRSREPRDSPESDGRFMLGISFGNAGMATDLAGMDPADMTDIQPGPVVVDSGGEGSERRYDQRFWVSPLPTPGDSLELVLEWGDGGVPRTLIALDSGRIHAAAARAVSVWVE